MRLESVPVHNPEELNLVLGRSQFIKTVEGLNESLAQASTTLGAHEDVAVRKSPLRPIGYKL